MTTVPALSLYPPAPSMDVRAQLKATIKAKHEEQSEVQRSILAEMDLISEEELQKRHDISNALDDEIDRLLDEYKKISAAQGIAPTPRGPAPGPQQPKTTPRRTRVITRPPGAVKGGGVQNSSRAVSRPPPLQKKMQVPDISKTAVHVNPLASPRTMTSMQAMSACVVNI